MRTLKAEVAGGSSAGGACEKEVTALRKDLDSARMKQAQDFQELKNDVDNMRNRMSKLFFYPTRTLLNPILSSVIGGVILRSVDLSVAIYRFILE